MLFPVGKGGTVTLNADEKVNSFEFKDNCTLTSGGESLTVSGYSVIVDPGKRASIETPFSFGGESRQPLLKLGEGTLSLSGINTSAYGARVEAGTLEIGTDSAFPGSQPFTLTGNSTLALGVTQDVSELNFGLDVSPDITLKSIGKDIRGRMNFVADSVSVRSKVNSSNNYRLMVDGADLVFADGKKCDFNERNDINPDVEVTVTGNGLFQAGEVCMAIDHGNATLAVTDGGQFVCGKLVFTRGDSQYNFFTSKLRIAGGTAALGDVGRENDSLTNRVCAIEWDGGVIRNIDAATETVISNTLNSFTLGAGGENVFGPVDGGTIRVKASLSGDGALTVRGDGTVELCGEQSHKGGTRVESGTLALNGATLGDLSLAGGGFSFSSADNSVGTLQLENGESSMQIGDGGTVTFAASADVEWTPDSRLAITGDLDRLSIRFGTDKGGLTGDQLKQITCNGKHVRLNPEGYLDYVQGSLLILQ